MTLQGEYEPSAAKWVRDQVAEFEASDGQRANTLRGSKDRIVVITSVGSKSGKLRKNPVMRVEHDGQYVAVASYGGGPKDPTWAANFRARPEVDLQDGSDKATYTVRELAGDERAEWWQRAEETWPTYVTYREKTEAIGRVIPVFLLERA